MRYFSPLLLALPLLLTACNSAGSTAQAFCKDLEKGDWTAAFEQMTSEDIQKSLQEGTAEEQAMMQGLFGKSRCKVTAQEGDTVTFEFDSVNTPVVMQQVMAESMGLAFMSAFGGAESQEAMQQLIMSNMVSKLSAEDAPRIKLTKVVEMEEIDGHWQPTEASSDDFFDGITGGLGSFSASP